MKYLLNKIVKINNSLGKVVSQLGSSGDVMVMDEDTFDLVKVNSVLSDLEIVENGQESTVEDFYDLLSNNYFYDDTIQELKLLDEGNKADKLMDMTISEAVRRNVYLSNLDDFDSDKFFFNIIKDYRL